MKKLYVLILTLLILGMFISAAQAATQEQLLTQALGSPNTAANGPVVYLIDGEPETVWNINEKFPKSAWAELRLAAPVLIDGLRFYGSVAGEITVEYWQNGGWHYFIAANGIPEENFASGWNFLDLSYDRIVTDRIRIRLTNPKQLAQIGGIGEIKVFGRNSQNMLERLEPVSVTGNRDYENGHPATNLFDHNTYTSWRFYPGGSNSTEAVADLGESCTVTRIKIFSNNNEKKYNNQGVFKIQYYSGGNWIDVPGLTNLNIQGFSTGWKSYNLPEGLKTDKIKIVFSNNQRADGLREVEIWGWKALPCGSSYLQVNQTSTILGKENSANYAFSMPSTFSDPIVLHVVAEGNSDTPLSWELNGLSMGELNAHSTIRGRTIYRQTISTNLLWPDLNYLRISGNGLTIKECKLEISQPYTTTVANTNLTDGWLLTPVSGGEQVIDLNNLYHVDEIIIKYLENQPTVQLAIEQNGKWVNINNMPVIEIGALGGELKYSVTGITRYIKLSFNAMGNRLTEIVINSSQINDGAPRVKINSPVEGSVFNLSEWGQAYITGTVDNPDATVRVNGQGMTLNGTEFKVPLPVAGNPDGNKLIEVVATDSQGRTGSDRVNIIISNPPDFFINLPDQIIYTTESRITVSGKVVIPQSQVTINGVAVPVTNLKFSGEVLLKEGLNIITVRLVPNPGSPHSNTMQRRVVRTSAAPNLRVLYPADGQIVKDNTIVVSGEVESLLPVTVTVNSKSTVIDGMNFRSTPIELTEGENRLIVVATDKNGTASRVELIVKRDQKAPVLSEITPLDRQSFNTPNIKVQGKVTDISPVSVIVNGIAADISDGRFSVTVPVKEGWNNLKTVATDCAGNITHDNQQILIDFTPPLAFTPVAIPDDWTNNNKPTITFSTSDASSGIDYYQISVDDGPSYGPITSPYTFPVAIPDGIHTVTIKAYDKAGNFTIGQVKIYIDTTPPTAPNGFEVITGINRIILHWKDELEDIKGYRIKRIPAFANGNYREIEHNFEPIILDEYIDEEVNAGTEYTYVVQAYDLAGNYGKDTAPITVKIGTISNPVNENGGTAKFDFCEVILDKGVLSEAAQLVIEESSGISYNNPFAVPVSSSYSITLRNQANQELEAKLKKPALLNINYKYLTIPSGYTQGDLGIYWYNKEGGYWEKLEHVYNDPLQKVLTVKLTHFSDYMVMASKYNSPSLDSYYALGIAPYKDYFQNNIERVSPADGNLVVEAFDLSLPGRNGFDLQIKRIYDAISAKQEYLIETNTKKDGSRAYKSPVDTFGYGWSLSIPWIEESDKGRFIRLPEGITIKIEEKDGKFEFHNGHHFILKDNVLILNTGVKYEFDDTGKVIRQIDPTGKNVISYTYNGREISQITDSIGRVLKFQYRDAGNKRVISRIEYDQYILKYSYSDDGVLTEAYDPMDRKTTYQYQTLTFKEGTVSDCEYEYRYRGSSSKSNNTEDETFSFNSQLLNAIIYPTGEKSAYSYKILSQDYSENWTSEYASGRIRNIFRYSVRFFGSRFVIEKHTLANKETIYSYVMNNRVGSYENYCFIPDYYFIKSCTINEGIKVTVQTFQQIVWGTLITDPTDASDFKGSLLVENSTFLIDKIDNNKKTEYEKITYEYDLQIRVLIREKHYRNGEFAYEISKTYDSWGNTTRKYDGSRNLKETWTYYEHPSIKNLVGTYVKEYNNPFTPSSTLVTTYVYDDSTGKPTKVTEKSGSQIRETIYTYTEYGCEKTKTAPNGLITENFYDSTGAFLVKTVNYGVEDADGNTTDITTFYEYNPKTGLKTWEKDANGHQTSYEYDKLNRITKIILPDDDSIPSNNPFRSYNFDDKNNLCYYRDELGHLTKYVLDKLGRITEVIKYTNGSRYPEEIKTEYRYNSRGKIDQVVDSNKNATYYEYDGLDRVTRITYPDQTFVTLQYDDASNTVIITDENGGVVTEQNDWAGRLIKAQQFCVFENETNIYTWEFFYDSFDNKIRAKSPLDDVTDQYYNAFNELTKTEGPVAELIKPGGSETQKVRPTTHYEYDVMGNKTGETDPNGNRVSYEYDQLGRLIKEIKQSFNVFTGETEVLITKHYYDAVGNKIKTVDPKNGETIYLFCQGIFVIPKRSGGKYYPLSI